MIGMVQAAKTTTLKFRRAKRLVDTEYQRPWTAASLSEAAGLSVPELQRLFKLQLGMPAMRYLSHVRVRAAGELLIAGHSVSDTARLCGFLSTASLSAQFRRVTGSYASNYRFEVVGWKYGEAAMARRTVASGDGAKPERRRAGSAGQARERALLA